MIATEILEAELNKFISLKNYFQSQPGYTDLDQFGFALGQENTHVFNVHLFLCGLTHGNEVIGLQIINLMLEEIKTKNLNPQFAFLLNNVEAYRKNTRFIQYDLNRSFLRSSNSKTEFTRASQIEDILFRVKPDLLIDLHQTVEATDSAFAILPQKDHLICLAHLIAPKLPVVTFSHEGFSKKGKTLGEFAMASNIPSLVYELGSQGFIDSLAHEFKEILLSLETKTILGKCTDKSLHNIEYFHLESIIPNQNNWVLLPGMISFQKLKKDQVLARNHQGQDFKAPQDSILIFPRYRNIEKDEQELGYLGLRKLLNAGAL